jgi:hypothetical protein
VKRKKSSDYDKISHLIPLRVTEDLTVDESKSVDETARYDEQSRSELHAFSRTISVLHEAASAPLPEESDVVRGEGSLWDRIEPRLGPAGKHRSRSMEWLPTRYMVAACLGLFFLTGLSETKRFLPSGFGNWGGDSAISTVGLPGAMTSAPHRQQGHVQGIQVVVLPIPGESLLVTELGMMICRIERLMQHKLGLPDQNGVVVTQVVPNSWADKAGIKPGDCIISVDKKSVYAPRHTVEVLAVEMQDETANFMMIRNHQRVEVTVRWKKPQVDEGKPASKETSVLPTNPFHFSVMEHEVVGHESMDDLTV